MKGDKNMDRYYSVDIDRSVESVLYCLKRFNNEVENSYEWSIYANGGGIDYGLYFNIDLNTKELEISNQSRGEELDSLDDIIDAINENDEEDEE